MTPTAAATSPGLADQPNAVGFVICEATTGQRLGNIALRHDATVGEVSYWVAASARGRGVATRALRLFSDWAFAALELSVIRLWTHADNAASRLVAERAGYRRVPDDDQRRTVKDRSGTPSAISGPLQTWPAITHRPRPESPHAVLAPRPVVVVRSR